MGWLWLGVAALLGAVVGFLFGGYLYGRMFKYSVEPTLRRDTAADRTLALSTLRRELANYMVRQDPDRYLRLYREARAADIAIGKADKASREAQLATITNKYPYYKDFDFLSTREHVLYAGTLSRYSVEEIEEHYLNMVKFEALQCAIDEEWQLLAVELPQTRT
jgi:hypothetical protein